MGSLFGPVQQTFLAKLKNGPLKDTLSHLKSYYCHIDDAFIVLEKEHEKDNLLSISNNIHLSITSTRGEEQTNRLTDVQLRRRVDGTLKRGIHRKSAVGQHTYFNSSKPIIIKRK